MKKLIFAMTAILVSVVFASAQTTGSLSGAVTDPAGAIIAGATVKVKNVVQEVDSTQTALLNINIKLLKKNAHASYYHHKFNGKRTASGQKFDNNAYTAAHKRLPFGTKLKVTNEANGKFVIVEITDRGPFTKAREIDLTKRAFMEIANNKNSGVVFVTIEVLEDKK